MIIEISGSSLISAKDSYNSYKWSPLVRRIWILFRLTQPDTLPLYAILNMTVIIQFQNNILHEVAFWQDFRTDNHMRNSSHISKWHYTTISPPYSLVKMTCLCQGLILITSLILQFVLSSDWSLVLYNHGWILMIPKVHCVLSLTEFAPVVFTSYFMLTTQLKKHLSAITINPSSFTLEQNKLTLVLLKLRSNGFDMHFWNSDVILSYKMCHSLVMTKCSFDSKSIVR